MDSALSYYRIHGNVLHGAKPQILMGTR
jgi:hypothetical protein